MNLFGVVADHPLTHRVGWVLVHSLWEGALIAGGFACVRLGLRRRSAQTRYLVACVTLAAVLSGPLLTMLLLTSPLTGSSPRHSASDPPASSSTPGVARAVEPFAVPSSYDEYLRHGTELLDRCVPWMVQLWIVGVMLLSCRWIHGTSSIRRLQTGETEPLDPVWFARLRELSRKVGLKRPVRLLKSALVEVPMVVGWLRPVILLPASALAGLTPAQLEAILAHELAHVRRSDYLVNSFQILVETLMFYHPAVWWISRCIREERENCCDDMVVRVCGDRMTYVRALVTLEEARSFPRLAFAATGGSLLQRVRRLLTGTSELRPVTPGEFGGITLVAIGCVFVLVAIWLYNIPANYQVATLIRISPRPGAQTIGDSSSNDAFYTHLLQTECLVIRSPAVLERAAQTLRPAEITNRNQSQRQANVNLDQLKYFRTRISLSPIPSTSVIEIRASDSDPAEAARLANAVALSYKQFRYDQRRDAMHASLDALETRFAEQAELVRRAAQQVDHLRAELKIPDAAAAENMPTTLLSAETLRHIEGLRIESQADYAKQKMLLERLENLDPKDLPAMISTVGVADIQLANFCDSLGLVEQKLVALQKELGPQSTEVLKAGAQRQDLIEKVQARTSGILKGLRAKLDSTAEGLAALSNAVVTAQNSDIETARASRPYFEAKRNLEELQRFSSVLQTKIATERTDLQLPAETVEIIEEAVAPPQADSPNHTRAFALFGAGLLLFVAGWLLSRTSTAPVISARTA